MRIVNSSGRRCARLLGHATGCLLSAREGLTLHADFALFSFLIVLGWLVITTSSGHDSMEHQQVADDKQPRRLSTASATRCNSSRVEKFVPSAQASEATDLTSEAT